MYQRRNARNCCLYKIYKLLKVEMGNPRPQPGIRDVTDQILSAAGNTISSTGNLGAWQAQGADPPPPKRSEGR